MSRLDFLRQEAPDNYVAGIGRGATGFTTRSDIGPAREGPSEAALVAAIGRQARASAGLSTEDDDDALAELQDEEGLLARAQWQDQEDDEADRIFDAVEARLDRRRQTAKLERQRKEQEEYAKKNPTIQEQFADVKRGLATVTDDEWANIPEAGDTTGKNKRRQNLRERTYAVGDSVLVGMINSSQYNSTVGTSDGMASTVANTQTDFVEMGAARDRLLASSLETALSSGTDSVLSSTNIDPRGYMTSLSTLPGQF